MSITTYQSPLNMSANTAAAGTNGTAVALAELPATFVSFQWQQASLPPTQNINSAASPVPPARQFSGKSAICVANAANAVTTAICCSF